MYGLVSVPIRGLFNLTSNGYSNACEFCADVVSVPIRGLFNLTGFMTVFHIMIFANMCFRPHQGII